MNMPIILTESLVDTAWLAANLGHLDLRIIDCSYIMEITETGLSFKSGKADWGKAHIPNSIYIDLLEELSDKNSAFPFMMPRLSQFAHVMTSKGIGNNCTVVVYDRDGSIWSARLWLMLQEMGFENAAILNGGWKKWEDEGRSIASGPFAHPKAQFTARPRRQSLIADKEEVLKAVKNGSAHLINALDEVSFSKGHIPHSLNIPFTRLIDPESNCLLSSPELDQVFKSTGLTKDDRIITYCGGGIASAFLASVLFIQGYDNVAVYDASLDEWTKDPNLPMERD